MVKKSIDFESQDSYTDLKIQALKYNRKIGEYIINVNQIIKQLEKEKSKLLEQLKKVN